MATFLLCKEAKLKFFVYLYLYKALFNFMIKKAGNLGFIWPRNWTAIDAHEFSKYIVTAHSVETTEIFPQKFREIDGFIAKFNSELLWRNFF